MLIERRREDDEGERCGWGKGEGRSEGGREKEKGEEREKLASS